MREVRTCTVAGRMNACCLFWKPLCGSLLFSFASLVFLTPVFAATINVDVDGNGDGVVAIADDGFCSLREAVEKSNGFFTEHEDCAEGDLNAPDTIVLPDAVFTLADAVEGTGFGGSGLPVIQEDLTIEGNGATIQRDPTLDCTLDNSSTASEFRLLRVFNEIVFTARDLTLRNGCAGGGGNEGDGGAIWSMLDAEIMLERVTVDSNSAAYRGGGINSGGTLTLIASTVSRNTVASSEVTIVQGGGIHGGPGETKLTNTTISGNSSSWAGGIFTAYDLTMENVTLSNNSADFAGGLLADDAGPAVINAKNVIFDESGCETRTGVSWNAEGSSLDSGSSCADLFGSAATADADIRLEALDDYGGPTETHALGSGSAAIDTATDCTAFGGGVTIDTDQRDIPRPQGDECDIGAFEFLVPLIFTDRFEQI